MTGFRQSKAFHRLYDLSMFIKGFDGVLECIGGLLLFFISHARLDALATFLTQHELSQDSDDQIANAVLLYIRDLPNGAKVFGALYLLAHGVLKVFLAYNLLRERYWVFPIALAILGVFVGYQSYRLLIHFSYGIALFTSFDLVVIWFVWNEYAMVKGKREHPVA